MTELNNSFPLLGTALVAVASQVDANLWVPALNAAFSQFNFDTKQRVAAAVGQFLLEAGPRFEEVRENMDYTHAAYLSSVFPHVLPTAQSAEPFLENPQALANKVYANFNGNGDEASGDGYRFRGGGLIQLTGRNMYGDFGAAIGQSADEACDYCQTPEGAAMSGCWFLADHGCLPFADLWAISKITRIVNGPAMRNNAKRIEESNAMLSALNG